MIFGIDFYKNSQWKEDLLHESTFWERENRASAWFSGILNFEGLSLNDSYNLDSYKKGVYCVALLSGFQESFY